MNKRLKVIIAIIVFVQLLQSFTLLLGALNNHLLLQQVTRLTNIVSEDLSMQVDLSNSQNKFDDTVNKYMASHK